MSIRLNLPVPVHGFDPGATVARVPEVASREPITTPQGLCRAADG